MRLREPSDEVQRDVLYLYLYEPGAGFIDQRIPAGHGDGDSGDGPRGLCVCP